MKKSMLLIITLLVIAGTSLSASATGNSKAKVQQVQTSQVIQKGQVVQAKSDQIQLPLNNLQDEIILIAPQIQKMSFTTTSTKLQAAKKSKVQKKLMKSASVDGNLGAKMLKKLTESLSPQTTVNNTINNTVANAIEAGNALTGSAMNVTNTTSNG
jgi:hypothetical protein